MMYAYVAATPHDARQCCCSHRGVSFAERASLGVWESCQAADLRIGALYWSREAVTHHGQPHNAQAQKADLEIRSFSGCCHDSSCFSRAASL